MPEIAKDRARPSREELEEEVIRLGPWHLDVEIDRGVSTRAFLQAPASTYPDSLGKVAFQDVRELFLNTLRRLYPDGLEGRSVLDCACNCGGYLFWAKEFGAGQCFGFDVRPLWIEQARFLAKHRAGPGEDIRFEVCDLYALPELDLPQFDITLFNGIFYHLPEPVTGLKIAADLTKGLLIVNTATTAAVADGTLAVHDEASTEVMSGVYSLSWVPSGPKVMGEILNWAGFPETRCNWWRRRAGQRASGRERTEVFAAREPGTFASFDVPAADQYGRVRELVARAAPSAAAVLVASNGDDELLKLGDRRAWHFPQNEAGGWADYHPVDDAAAVAHLEELLAEGAEYLVLPNAAFWWLDHYEGFRRHLESRFEKLVEDTEACVILGLRGRAPAADQYGRVRELVAWAVPSGAAVLVVSRGDDELLELGDRRARHFPQNEAGGWAGHYPADDAAAVVHLEELLAEGAEYLVLPNAAFWWLDHYEGFRHHLESRFEKLVEDGPACVVFGLRDRD